MQLVIINIIKWSYCAFSLTLWTPHIVCIDKGGVRAMYLCGIQHLEMLVFFLMYGSYHIFMSYYYDLGVLATLVNWIYVIVITKYQ